MALELGTAPAGLIVPAAFAIAASVGVTGALGCRAAASGDTAVDSLMEGVVVTASPDTMPEIASWLALRQAASVRDSAARSVIYTTVTLPVARDRIPWVEAQAREASGDLVGALHAYEALPAPITKLRLRYAMAADDSGRMTVRREIVRVISTAPDGSTVREASALFDTVVAKPTTQEQLIIARSSARVGAWSRARSGYAAASKTTSWSSQDHFNYANALARTNAQARAAVEYARVKAPAALAAAAMYQRARMLLAAGKSVAASTQLKALESRYPRDTSAAWALWLRADLASDASSDRTAQWMWQKIARRFPKSRFAVPARFNAAMVDYIAGRYDDAARVFHAIVAQDADNDAARYWAARADALAGDSVSAQRGWQRIVANDSTSYYAVLAARRLGIPEWGRGLGSVPVDSPRVRTVDSAAHRISQLRALAMAPEIRFEVERLMRDASESQSSLFATAMAFSGTEESSRAIHLGKQALEKYGVSPLVYRLIYPIAARDTIVEASKKAGIDPILVAALIRQESNFNPRATSSVGARGLMQVMPSVASAIADHLGIQPWSTGMLYRSGLNIQIGVTHLAPLIRAHPDIVRVLAAYNAGESRVVRWAKKAGADDPEVFTERIPFPETREYVKNILRNREFYRALYAW